MSKAPWSPRLLAIILFGVAISFPIQIMLLYGHSPLEWPSVLSKLTLFNYLAMAGCLTSAYYLWNCNRKSLAYLAGTALAMTWNNFLVGYVAYDYSMATTISASGFFISTYALMLHPDALKMLRLQNQRWWMQSERKALRFPAEVSNMEGTGFPTRTYDLSVSGAYISLENDNAFQGLQVGDYCTISIQVTQYRKLKGLARIVRQSQGAGKYPKGFGLHFEKLNSEDQKYLEEILGGSQADLTH